MESWAVIFIFSLLIGSYLCDNENNYFEQTFDGKTSPVSDISFTLPIQTGIVQFSSSKPKLIPVQSRRKKRSPFLPPSSIPSLGAAAEDVCPSVSDWVAKSHAVDPYGNEVTIVQRIPINGTVVNQYFYETFCAADLVYEYDDFFGTSYQRVETPESTQCKGIDVLKWNSHCKENFIWTYGKVADVSGHTGWSIIGIRGSCSCAIWPKVQPRSTPLPNLLSKSRGQRMYSAGPSSSSSPGRGRRLIPETKSSMIKSTIQADPFF